MIREKQKLGFVLVMAALYSVAKLGKAAGLTDTLAELLGREPTRFRQFAEDTKAVWLTTQKSVLTSGPFKGHFRKTEI